MSAVCSGSRPASSLRASSIWCFSARPRSSTFRPASAGRSSPCSRLPPCTRFMTTRASFMLATVPRRSFSSSRKSAAASSRMAVASFNAFVSAATWSLRFAMVAASSPTWALRRSISAVSSLVLVSASAIAFVFSFSLVSHQQTILSYMSASVACSCSSCALILRSRLTTRLTGVSFSRSRDHSCSKARSPASTLFSRLAAPAREAARASARSAARAPRCMAAAGLGWGCVGGRGAGPRP
mmetsp:Transcript_21895/g.69115  ORF Transcript_21895/g.69115 Transcript_21895/m.69115 type:complete len:240 (+) Transcript_21895:605-1324(+)